MMPVLAGVLGGGGGVSTLVYDQFLNTNGILLQNHAPLIGGPWIKQGGVDYAINTNEAYSSAGEGSPYGGYAVDTGRTEYKLTYRQKRTGTSNAYGVLVRGVSASSRFFCQMNFGTSLLQIYEVDTATFTLRGQIGFTPPALNGYAAGIVVVTTGGIYFEAGGNAVTYASTSKNTGTKVGLLCGSGNVGRWDDFKAETL